MLVGDQEVTQGPCKPGAVLDPAMEPVFWLSLAVFVVPRSGVLVLMQEDLCCWLALTAKAAQQRLLQQSWLLL